MTKADEDKVVLDQAVADLVSVIRQSVIRPPEAAITTIQRIGMEAYELAVLAHASEQLRGLAKVVDVKLRTDTLALRRLDEGLEAFVRQLIQLSRRTLYSRPARPLRDCLNGKKALGLWGFVRPAIQRDALEFFEKRDRPQLCGDIRRLRYGVWS
jgi:hypothetical protein